MNHEFISKSDGGIFHFNDPDVFGGIRIRQTQKALQVPFQVPSQSASEKKEKTPCFQVSYLQKEKKVAQLLESLKVHEKKRGREREKTWQKVKAQAFQSKKEKA